MDPVQFHRLVEAQKALIATLPAAEREVLEALVTETMARYAEIETSRDQALAAADRFDDATVRLHEAATRTARDSARALDGVQDALIDLNCVALDLEAKNRERGGSR